MGIVFIGKNNNVSSGSSGNIDTSNLCEKSRCDNLESRINDLDNQLDNLGQEIKNLKLPKLAFVKSSILVKIWSKQYFINPR